MASDEQDTLLNYWLTRTEDIQAALFELGHPDSRINVRNAADQEIAVEILAVDRAGRCFYWRPRDYAGSDFAGSDRQSMLAGSVFHFQAQGYSGVQINFRITRPQVVRADDGTPALASPFPERLTRVQRRKTFRAPTSNARLNASGRWLPEDGRRFLEFSVRDVSVDGIGLRTETAAAELPPVGTLMKGVSLDFDSHGTLVANLRVCNVYPIGAQRERQSDDEPPAPAGAPAPLTHLGATFCDLDARQQTWLQQVVWYLEKARIQQS